MTARPFSEGTVLLPWKPGPRSDIEGPVFVSVTDFLAASEEDAQSIYRLGSELSEAWPVMQGAVGVWLWARPAQLRGGSISVWQSEQDMRRFVRWPVHGRIVRSWRGRVRVAADSWSADRLATDSIWSRAGNTIDRPHAGSHPAPPGAGPGDSRVGTDRPAADHK